MCGWTGRRCRGGLAVLTSHSEHLIVFFFFFCFSEVNIFSFHRLLAQLRDMESAFDGFFEKHRLKLHQYQQLLKYEKSFQEVRKIFFSQLLAIVFFSFRG